MSKYLFDRAVRREKKQPMVLSAYEKDLYDELHRKITKNLNKQEEISPIFFHILNRLQLLLVEDDLEITMSIFSGLVSLLLQEYRIKNKVPLEEMDYNKVLRNLDPEGEYGLYRILELFKRIIYEPTSSLKFFREMLEIVSSDSFFRLLENNV